MNIPFIIITHSDELGVSIFRKKLDWDKNGTKLSVRQANTKMNLADTSDLGLAKKLDHLLSSE